MDYGFATPELLTPDKLPKSQWQELQFMYLAALKARIGDLRSDAEIHHFVGMDDPELFYESHLDPNVLVGGKYNANQEYSDPQVAVVRKRGEIVAWAYGANNVSGETPLKRQLKKLYPPKNYFWIREIVTDSDYQGHHLARTALRELLHAPNGFQGATTYVYEETPYLMRPLERYSFKPFGVPTSQSPYGPDAAPSLMTLMRARSVLEVRDKMKKDDKYDSEKVGL